MEVRGLVCHAHGKTLQPIMQSWLKELQNTSEELGGGKKMERL